jgi:hypothetical protein
MIGFIAAISGVLAIIVLVTIANFLTFVASIMPANGLIKIDEFKYRYVMEERFVTSRLLDSLVENVYDFGLTDNIKNFQNGCNYGFNYDKNGAENISTYNYIVMQDYFRTSYKIDSILIEVDMDRFNVCYIDINLVRPHF